MELLLRTKMKIKTRRPQKLTINQENVGSVLSVSNIRTYIHEAHGTKRKFDFDMDKVEIAAREAEEAAMREIEKEQVHITFFLFQLAGVESRFPYYRPRLGSRNFLISGSLQ